MHDRRMLEQEVAKSRLAIQSLDEQKRAQSAETRKHQEAVRLLEDGLKKERQRTTALEEELKRTSKLRDENTRLQMELEHGKTAATEAERKVASVEATHSLAEQLEQENADMHNEIAA